MLIIYQNGKYEDTYGLGLGPLFSCRLFVHSLRFLLYYLTCQDGYLKPGNTIWRGRLSTVDLLVLTSLDELLFILKILLTFVTKHATLMRRSTVLNLPVRVPCSNKQINFGGREPYLQHFIFFVIYKRVPYVTVLHYTGLDGLPGTDILAYWAHL
jgi:hypothetical protein